MACYRPLNYIFVVAVVTVPGARKQRCVPEENHPTPELETQLDGKVHGFVPHLSSPPSKAPSSAVRAAHPSHHISTNASIAIDSVRKTISCRGDMNHRSPSRDECSSDFAISHIISELSRLQHYRAGKRLLKQKIQVTDSTCDAYSTYFEQLIEYCNEKGIDINTDLRGSLTRYSESVLKTCEDIEALCNVSVY